MKQYDRWVVNQNDKTIYSGGLTKLLERFNLNKTQFYELLKNQQFPYGQITKKVDYYDYTIDSSFSFKNKNMVTYMRCLCSKALIGCLEEYDCLEATVDSIMNNEYDSINFGIIQRMAKLAFSLEKVVIKLHEHPRSETSKIISIRLPMKEYPSCCFIVSDYSLTEGHNNGYHLIKDIFEEIHKLVNSSSNMIGKVIYRGSEYYDPLSHKWTYDVIRSSAEKFDMNYYSQCHWDDYYNNNKHLNIYKFLEI